ncbi:hypothetical protein PIIN_11441 [Serendipita indica DSM 11827]|uniref:Uncharacterized protein n=1 Tax=Serendipita indica (strain DSM 11827) TaxID=1109443 RepID=G4U1M1_SERID|nr:hypothetical protein PIIN_11441 [Serendipita indica DSM 11827]
MDCTDTPKTTPSHSNTYLICHLKVSPAPPVYHMRIPMSFPTSLCAPFHPSETFMSLVIR